MQKQEGLFQYYYQLDFSRESNPNWPFFQTSVHFYPCHPEKQMEFNSFSANLRSSVFFFRVKVGKRLPDWRLFRCIKLTSLVSKKTSPLFLGFHGCEAMFNFFLRWYVNSLILPPFNFENFVLFLLVFGQKTLSDAFFHKFWTLFLTMFLITD